MVEKTVALNMWYNRLQPLEENILLIDSDGEDGEDILTCICFNTSDNVVYV